MGCGLIWEPWLHAMTEAVGEIAETSLGYDGCRVLEQAQYGSVSTFGVPVRGAVISLCVREQILNLALYSDSSGCRRLAQAFLGMTEDEELPEPDVDDSLRELVNILAGGVKRRLPDLAGELWLGLPASVTSQLEPGRSDDATLVNLSIGPVPVQVQLVQNFSPGCVPSVML